MPRNGAGTFSIVNPIVVGALRSSSAVNQNFTDAGDEITNSLPINGEAGMSGQFKAADGSALAPGITFGEDTNTGFRRSATDEMKWVAGATDRATMDANGKLTLAGGLSVAGALTHQSGDFGPQTLAGTGAARAVLRCSANDTDEHELASYRAGSGAGAKGSLRMVGGGANDVATMRFYVNDILTFQWTGSLFTHSVDTLFGASGIRGDTDGFLDFPEITAPTAPASNVARAYARDDGTGTTRLYYKDAAGVERALQPPTDRQVFTASGTWTKPTNGQTMAYVECWAGGGSGEKRTIIDATVDTDVGGAGAGGGAYIRRYFALSSLSASVAVTVGAGGAAQTVANTSGNFGGNSSFGAYLASYGGGGGGGVGSDQSGPAGAGGGLTSAAGVAGLIDAPSGGDPLGFLGSEIWGIGDGFVSTFAGSNPFGGAGAEREPDLGGQAALFGGGSGAAGAEAGEATDGGASIYGGGGGGCGISSGTPGSGGVSVHGGNGGAGATGSATATSGSAPGGGGGGSEDGTSGAGGRGEIRIVCW